MMCSSSRYKYSFLFIFLFLLLLSIGTSTACKDIIATGNSTAGEYNLLLKVRDPSRAGLQVLTRIPIGYEYTYHHPWTGKPIEFQVEHTYIGVTSEEDTPPNIVKSGMVLTDAGLAYGDADSLSRWINPSPFAWDDFDWIRYSCEQAHNETEAVNYLTKKAVDQLHATGVSENLCLVGPEKGYLIEADAYRYHTKEIIDDIDVISNYPRQLWDTQLVRSRFIAESYDAVSTKTVRRGDCIHLSGLARIRILDVTPNSVKVKQIPFFTNIGYHDGKPSFFMPPESVTLSDSKTIGDFYVTLQNISGNFARIRLTTAVYAWEQSMLDRIMQRKGNITVSDMMEWSRLQFKDVNDIRPMCEATYSFEGVAIYEIPQSNYEYLSKGWFSPNRACSSIYVPFHNSNIDIFNPYETGEAAEISLSLYQNYSDQLLPIIKSIEDVFITENSYFDKWAKETNQSDTIKAEVLTTIDTTMQQQAWIMQRLFYNISFLEENQKDILLTYTQDLWEENYEITLSSMSSVLKQIDLSEKNEAFKNDIVELMKLTPDCYINVIETIGFPSDDLQILCMLGEKFLSQEKYDEAAGMFQYIVQQVKDKLSE